MLYKDLEKDLNFCKDHSPHFDNFIKRLRNIQDFLKSNSGATSSSSSKNLSEQLNLLEENMYAILQEAAEFDESEKMDEEDSTRFREKIITLMKEMTSLKTSLRKTELEKLPERDHLLNRLEDLQENIADFEHNFSTKHFFNRGIGEKAKEKYKSKQLEDAQKEHQRIASEMFEL